MATGDQNDFVGRLQAALPAGWFADANSTPILTTLLNGFGSVFAYIYSLINYARTQSRLATSTDIFLDMFSQDFFALGLERNLGESDKAFAARIKLELLRPRVTRAAVVKQLVDLTGRQPAIFEPANPGDTGGWASIASPTPRGMAYNTAGGYGSLQLPYQFFITAYRPTVGGISNVMGYYGGSGYAIGGYGSGAIKYVTLSESVGAITDAQIDAAIARVIPSGVTAWTRISN